ncbi:hypothetical protein PGTUg99_030916 [Puccinia graminis f. sp. tritici]|uniref:Uncharacterized protein n=1 Tax=Puccinia graminis f. sp. tritici TaxID=56615 RepID=A0A5B0NN41_PUCGR|nr:hypothetical protein PGTUg99_030916 [Puccinia graminis f. sp. tritici]
MRHEWTSVSLSTSVHASTLHSRRAGHCMIFPMEDFSGTGSPNTWVLGFTLSSPRLFRSKPEILGALAAYATGCVMAWCYKYLHRGVQRPAHLVQDESHLRRRRL